MTRRNYPLAVKRPSWKMRGDSFSDLGVLIRCVTKDHTATVIGLKVFVLLLSGEVFFLNLLTFFSLFDVGNLKLFPLLSLIVGK